MSSISIAAEVTIDIDEKRRVWVELRAEGDNAEAIAGVLASEAARVAVDAYTQATTRVAERGREVVTGTFGDNLDAPVSSIGGGSITEQGIAEAVWDKDTADHVAEGTFGNLMQRLLTVARYLGLR